MNQTTMELDNNTLDFILEHENEDPAKLMLRRDRYPDVDMETAVRCIKGRQTARQKLPLWYSEPRLSYPPSLSLEQCSSQATALYKQRLVSPQDRIADLTGGLGADSCFLSMKAASVDYFEQNPLTAECARYNLALLGRDNIQVHCQEISRETLGQFPTDKYSLVYLDPARRGKRGERVFSLHDCEPDITSLKDLLFRIASRILLKTSPMADLSALIAELPETVRIDVVASGNECKEVLVLLDRNASGDEPEIHAADADSGLDFRFRRSEEQNAVCTLADPCSLTGKYLYEPSPALLKSGAFRLPALRLGLEKISTGTHYYTGETVIGDFPGKIRKITEVLPFNKKTIKGLKERYPECSVTTRNFPMSSEELAKRLHTAESSRFRLLATTASDGSRILIVSLPL